MKGRRTGFKSRTFQLLSLRFGWVVVVIWFEVGEVRFFHRFDVLQAVQRRWTIAHGGMEAC
jgi:hypothetical protein